MLDSIFIGMSGLQGYSRGLKVIANNTANMNTPGFKSSSLQFSDMFYSGNAINGSASNFGQIGHGLNTNGTSLNFKQGDLRQTGNPLDLAMDGDGLFTLKNSNGKFFYTKAGQFEFNSDGTLVNRADGAKVMGRDSNGNLTELSFKGAHSNSAKASSSIKFIGNLSSTASNQSVGAVKVIDSAGGEHTLTLNFTNTNATTAGSWKVEIMDGTTAVATTQIIFENGKPTVATAKLNFSYTTSGLPAIPIQLDFSSDVTSFASGNISTLAFGSQDGYAPGTLTGITFDTAGAMVLAYSNGQTVKGSKLAFGRFDTIDGVEAVGGNLFQPTNDKVWHFGTAGGNGFGNVKSGMVEVSNVDLSQEFSDLVIMQRGYQASSQIVTTANEMIQELFAMKGK